MHSAIARAAILVCLACGLTGCSSTSGSKSWWPSFSFKGKSNPASNVATNNAPQAPTYNSTAASPAMPGAYGAAAPQYGGTQYPVTPYPSTGAGAYTASAPPASNGYMPPNNPYAATAPANPYAPAQPSNPYATPATNSYAPPQNASYSTAGQYGAAPYPGGPTGGDAAYSYTR